MKLPKPLERDVSKAIVDWFAAVYRIELHRRNTGAVMARYGGKNRMIRFSKPGQADLYGIIAPKGTAIECEVKRQGERPTPEQIAWLASCREKGAIAFWADSVEMADREYQRQRDFPVMPAFERSMVSSGF